MCPNCRAFISVKDRVCPYCGVQLGPRAIDLRASRFAASFLPSANLTSAIFLTINIALFIAELLVNRGDSGGVMSGVGSQTAILMGAKYAPLIRAGQWWRLITAGFLHGGFVHILMNSWTLFILVTEAEQFYGPARTVFTYLFSTVTGFYLSMVWSPHSLSLGASAACFGYFGLMLAMAARRRADPLAQAVRAHYGQWVIFGLILSVLPGVDMAAHIGGFIGGFLVGIVGGLPGLPGAPREIMWKLLATAAVAITIYAFWLDYLSYHALLRQLNGA